MGTLLARARRTVGRKIHTGFIQQGVGPTAALNVQFRDPAPPSVAVGLVKAWVGFQLLFVAPARDQSLRVVPAAISRRPLIDRP